MLTVRPTLSTMARTPTNLSDLKAPEKFAGNKVTFTSALNTNTRTIQVESIAAASESRLLQAPSLVSEE